MSMGVLFSAGMPLDTHHVFMSAGVTNMNGNSAAVTTTQEDDAANATIDASNLANTKEKTPMCLVNELARYNKVSEKKRMSSDERVVQ